MAKEGSAFTRVWLLSWCCILIGLIVVAALGFSYSYTARRQRDRHRYCLTMTKEWVPPLPATSGDSDGYGFGSVTLDLHDGWAEFSIRLANVLPDEIVSFQIRGPASSTVGDLVIQISETTVSDGVLTGGEQFPVNGDFEDVVNDPRSYYAVINTGVHPSGSIADRLGSECRIK
jgi:hypothetical protein